MTADACAGVLSEEVEKPPPVLSSTLNAIADGPPEYGCGARFPTLRFLPGRSGRLDEELVLMRRLSEAVLMIVSTDGAASGQGVCDVRKYTNKPLATTQHYQLQQNAG